MTKKRQHKKYLKNLKQNGEKMRKKEINKNKISEKQMLNAKM